MSKCVPVSGMTDAEVGEWLSMFERSITEPYSVLVSVDETTGCQQVTVDNGKSGDQRCRCSFLMINVESDPVVEAGREMAYMRRMESMPKDEFREWCRKSKRWNGHDMELVDPVAYP